MTADPHAPDGLTGAADWSRRGLLRASALGAAGLACGRSAAAGPSETVLAEARSQFNHVRVSERGTVRTISSIRMVKRGPLITLRFEGSGFLYKMVRLLTGTLVRVAQGRLEPAFIRELLAEPGQRKTSFAAPAEGLYLTRVLYRR